MTEKFGKILDFGGRIVQQLLTFLSDLLDFVSRKGEG